MAQPQSTAHLDAPGVGISITLENAAAIAVGLFNKGVWHLHGGRRTDAQDVFRAAAALAPDFGWAFLALGRLAVEDGQLAHAARALSAALRCGRIDAAGSLISLAGRHSREGRPADAERVLGELGDAALCPDNALAFAEALGDLGAVWHLQGQLHKAACRTRGALALVPDNSRIWGNLGACLKVQGLLDEAERACRRSLAVDALNYSTHVNLLQTLEHQPDLSEDALFQEHVAWGRLYGEQAAGRVPAPANACDPERRLRVGYVALNFSGGPRRLFVTHLLEHRDRAGFETFCYSVDPREADPPLPLRDAADHWRTTAGLSDEELVALIRADGIDILVDLDGHSNGNRLRAFAFKPAPVQISWVGYFHTTGLPAMDAIFMDEVMVPPGEDHRFVETVVRLPHSRFCYKAPDFAGPVAPPPSLTRGFITFGSFNLVAKIAPRVIRTWSRILKAVPNARLLLKSVNLSDPMVRRRLEMAFEAEGVDPQRLEWRGPSSHTDMFREYGDLDIALDPFPFTGGITSCEALWMGVPIVTLPGERPVSRQTVGLLKVLGLPELVARDEDDYVRIAVELASDPQRLTALRRELRPRMAASPLCDSAGAMRRAEEAFRDLWRGWCARPAGSAAPGHADADAPMPVDADSRDLVERGIRLHREQRLAEAEACYRRSLVWRPEEADALQLLAAVFAGQGRADPALRLLDRALRLMPRHVIALCNLGRILLDAGRAAEAAEAFRRLLMMQPDFAEAHTGLLRALAALGQPQALADAGVEAIRACPDLLRRDHEGLTAVFNAAVTLYGQGKPVEALRALEAIDAMGIDLLPSLKKALMASHYVAGQKAAEAGDRDAARRHYGRVLEIDPDAADAHAALGTMDFSERPYAATCHVVKAWELAPENPEYDNNAWQLLNKLGDEISSFEELSRDLDRDWTYAAQIGIGNALRRAGRSEEAEAAYLEAARRAPAFPFAYTRLGCLYATIDRHEEADRCFERAGQGRTRPREDAIRLSPEFLDRLPSIENGLPALVEVHGDALPDDAEFVILASGDAAYVARFAFALVNSIAQNCRSSVLVHLHTINPDQRVEAEIARIREKLPSVRLRHSHERTDVERFGEERKTYFASARFLILPHLLREYRKPILMLDLDLVLLRDPDPIRSMVGEADFGAVGGPMLEIWNEIWADVVYIRPTSRSVAFFDFAARYIRHFLDVGQARWFLDQIALFVALHRRQPEGERARVEFLPRHIHRLNMVILDDGSIQGSDDAFFWSVHASLPTSAPQIQSPQFQAYSAGT